MNAMPPEQPPHNIEAEQQLLGALLTNNDTFATTADLVSADAFFDPVHREIYERIKSRVDVGQIASPVTLKADLEGHEGLRQLGGVRYLARLAGSAVATFAARDYAQVIVDLKAKRDLLDATIQVREAVRDGSKTAIDIAIDLENRAGSVASKSSAKPLIRSHLSTLIGAVTSINNAYSGVAEPGISTGLPQLDKQLGGLRPGNLVVLAGRASMGKTSLAQNIAFHAAQNGIGVFFGSLEMVGEELAPRFISKGLATRGREIPYSRMISGHLSEREMRDVVEEAKRQEALPIQVGERDIREITRVRTAVKRAHQVFADTPTPLGLVVIDYVQRMESKTARSAYERVSQATDACKSLAMELNLPVIALAQLSRAVESRDVPIPMLSDLKESGSLEEDADVVMFCYREAYYLKRKIDALDGSDLEEENDLRLALSNCEHNLDIIVAKQRSGPVGTVRAYTKIGLCHVTADMAGEGGRMI